MRVLDLFSGIGGMSLGLERAGMQTVAFCEIDPFCRKVLAKHWPDVPIHEDIRGLTADAVGPVDVIAGGFPCQDVSNAGKRAGLAGANSGLYRELVRLVCMVRPKHAIVENVAALLGDGMDAVLGDLAEGGFDAEWDCVPASAVGAPHERDRVWIVAHPESDGCRSGRARRSPDSFARLRNTPRWNAADFDGERKSQQEGAVDEERRRSQHIVEAPPAFRRWEWPDEPALLGMDDGVPDRPHRVRALGNAVAPQVVEQIGGAIMAAHHSPSP